MRRRRRAAHQALAQAPAEMAWRLLARVPVRPRAVVAGYWPLGGEADPRPLLAALARRGHPIALPAIVAAGRPLSFRLWTEGGTLVPGAHGTRMPPPARPPVLPDIVIVPLLAFDARGHRLGQGGGYYDRTLALLRRRKRILAVGLAYAVQQVNSLATRPHDQRLDWIVTERAAICARWR